MQLHKRSLFSVCVSFRLQDNRLVLRGRNVVVELFSNLDRYLKEQRVKFKDLFDSLDTDRSGTLEIRELAQLVKQLVPGVTVPDVKYIMVGWESWQAAYALQRHVQYYADDLSCA